MLENQNNQEDINESENIESSEDTENSDIQEAEKSISNTFQITEQLIDSEAKPVSTIKAVLVITGLILVAVILLSVVNALTAPVIADKADLEYEEITQEETDEIEEIDIAEDIIMDEDFENIEESE